ncbi:MAG: hypothetical protein AABY64_13475 [Bdellovibrionota bacterium]
MRNIWIFWISILGIVTLSQPQSWAAEVKPNDSFVTIESPHFEVIINAQQQELGQYFAQKLEFSFGLLKEFFSVQPEKTIVIINDKTDVTNGYATRIPYPHVMIFPVLPGPTESLAEFGDWNLELLSHEYAHVLNFEPAPGFMGYLRPVFGSVIAPNILLPNWWKEGLAVHIETAVSNKGRLRSVYQDAVIRAFVLKNNLSDFNVAEINETIPTWPEGMRAYIFGSLIWSQMVADKTPGIVDTLNQRHGSRVPYFIETPAEENLGLSYEDFYKKTLRWTQEKSKTQILKLKTFKPTATVKFPSGAQYSNGASISPNGKYIAMITVSDTDKRLVKIYERKKDENFLTATPWGSAEGLKETTPPAKILDGPPTGSIQRISWFPRSTQIVYDRMDAVNSTETFSDLYIYNLQSKITFPLTKSLRAREPAVSPRGDVLAFVQLSASRTALALFDIRTKKVEVLKLSDIGERISVPTFLDESRIIFSLRNSVGDEHLYVFDIKTKTQSQVLDKYSDAKFPLVAGDEIFFTSSLNGTNNIYASSKDFKNVRPVSHTLTTLSSPAFDPIRKDLYATEITADGPTVILLEKKNQLTAAPTLPVIERLMAERYPAREVKKSESKTSDAAIPATTTYPVSDYSSASHLWPHYWIPFFATSSSSGGMVFQAITSGFDPLKKHMYQGNVSWDSSINRGSFEGSYINSMTSTNYLLDIYQTNTYLVTSASPLTNSGGAVGAAPDLWAFNRYTSGMLSWRYINTAFSTNSTSKRMGPGISLAYNNFSSSGAEIAPESGGSAYLSAVNYIQTGDYITHSQFATGGNYYFSKWLPARHSIMLRMNGVYTPEKIPSILGVSTISLMPFQDGSAPTYVMRGYLNGQFLGRTLVNTNLEYRFPLQNLYWGSGTNAIFLRRFHGAVVVDGVALDGAAYNLKSESFDALVITNKSIWSAGAEVRFETTLGYVMPFTLVLGIYNSLNQTYGSGTQLGLAIQLGGRL